MPELVDIVGTREIVVVANRLPVDRVAGPDGASEWRTSPGGLVTAMEPVVRELGCRWIGWAGDADAGDGEPLEPFDIGSMRLVPVPLSDEELAGYYEGFSNGTLWPLYHDVIAPPEYHREWWEHYERINRRFAEAAAGEAPRGAIVWVHDYQLQLVPAMLRELRPDLTIAFFLHIPFPAQRMFAQLPWRRRIIEGLLGADVIGFQREQDAVSFRMAAEQHAGAPSHGNLVLPKGGAREPQRSVLAQEFPISIDAAAFERLAGLPEVQARAREIRRDLGNPSFVLLGVDRLDYTKGIRHRLKAFAELLAEDELSPDQVVMVQVASPSRERVEAYRRLRDEVETTVGRINGDHGSIGHTPVVYLHRGFSREEMAALYLAADALAVTALRDGMNLVAKEYVACRRNEQGVLLLSEFAGAADELRQALLVNPHDIEGMKAGFLRAIHMPEREQQRRMRSMRAAVRANDVTHWAENFLRATSAIAERRQASAAASGEAVASGGLENDGVEGDVVGGSGGSGAAEHGETDVGGSTATGPIPTPLSSRLEGRLRRLATSAELIVACDFDGTLAPLVERPEDARILRRAQRALTVLGRSPGLRVVLISGRSLESLLATGVDASGWVLSGSHGIELVDEASPEPGHQTLDDDEAARLAAFTRRLTRVFGQDPEVRIEAKPFGVAIHTRRVDDAERSDEILDAAERFGEQGGFTSRPGKRVREFSLRAGDKGSALDRIRAKLPSAPVLFLGDDVTDEDVFAVLRVDDLGIKVGAGETAARERIPDPVSVAALLARLAELRTGVVIGDDTAENDSGLD